MYDQEVLSSWEHTAFTILYNTCDTIPCIVSLAIESIYITSICRINVSIIVLRDILHHTHAKYLFIQ